MIESPTRALPADGPAPRRDPEPTPGAAVAWTWQQRDPAAVTARAARAARLQGAIGGAVGIVIAAGLAFLLHKPTLGTIVAGVALVSTLAALLSPLHLYRWFKRALDAFGYAVGTTVTWILMVVLYALLFVPVGLVLRWSGKIALRAAADPKTPTFWRSLDPAPVNVDTYRNQF
jgi:hypothetical protein